MINFVGKRWIYIDTYILQSPYVEQLFDYFAAHHQAIILCVDSAMEKERLKTCIGFEYVSDVIYEDDIQGILKHIKSQHRKYKDIVVLQQHYQKTEKDLICLGIEDQFGDLATFIETKRRYDQSLYHKLCVVMIVMVCMMMITLFVRPKDYLLVGIIFCALCVIFWCCVYGVSKGVIKLGELFDVFMEGI